jgi:hypothetical protein
VIQQGALANSAANPTSASGVDTTVAHSSHDLQRYSWDDFTGEVENTFDSVSDTSSALVSSLIDPDSGKADNKESARDADSNWGASVGGAATKVAVSAANTLATKFGGSVTINPSGGADITIGDMEIAEVVDVRFVLPLGILTETIFDAGFAVFHDSWLGWHSDWGPGGDALRRTNAI